MASPSAEGLLPLLTALCLSAVQPKGPDLPALAGRAWQVANGIVDKVVDVACDIAPATLDRSTVSGVGRGFGLVW